MPEIEAVAPVAHPPQRRTGQNTASGAVSNGDDDDGHGHGKQRESPAEQPGRRMRRDTHHHQTTSAAPGATPRATLSATQSSVSEHDRDRSGRRPDQQAVGTGECVHVRAGRINRIEHQVHHDDRSDRPGATEQAHLRSTVPSERAHGQDHEWPHEVELLLDRERPEVGDGRWFAEPCPVVPATGDRAPVGHPPAGPQQITTQRRNADAGHGPDDGDRDEDRQARRCQSPDAAVPERPDVDPSRADRLHPAAAT